MESSRRRYLAFVADYRKKRLDDGEEGDQAGSPDARKERRGRRREYLRDYL